MPDWDDVPCAITEPRTAKSMRKSAWCSLPELERRIGWLHAEITWRGLSAVRLGGPASTSE
eukprot:scaffold353118_cov42-Prasinocladus_malaysianus.AAC.1